MKIARRTFLTMLAVVGGALGLFRGRHSLRVFFRGVERKAEPPAAVNPFVRQGRSLVAAVGGTEVKAMVSRAVELIGGFALLDLSGKKVLVKPNVVGGRSHPTTTNPAVVQAVVELLFEHGAAEVYVGDMSALVRDETAGNMEATGIAGAARRAGARTLSFEDHGWVRVKVDGRYIREVDVTEWFFAVDRVINLPVLKTHRYAGYSICLKNFVGATHFSQRPYLVDRAHWQEVVAELNLAFSPALNIVDGTRTMIAGGPWEGRIAQTNLVLAGGDRLACDVAGLGIIKSFGQWPALQAISPWHMGQVKRGVELGLGAAGSAQMELLAESLDQDPAFAGLIARVRSLIV
ncbi:MAG: DUF362 domain-containing protein [Thermodesulfobacteriota bacterium]